MNNLIPSSQFMEINTNNNTNLVLTENHINKGVIKGFKPSYTTQYVFNHKKIRIPHISKKAEIPLNKIVKRFKNMSLIDNNLVLTDTNRKLTIKIDSIKIPKGVKK